MASARFIVSGTVQGVFFRASTRARACELGLTGFARNRADGSVEIVACGSPDALRELEAWLHDGPAAARVVAVAREELPAQDHAGFTTQ
ncbi:MAG: acylphosphatase [Dokdonella sp.]